MIAIIDYGMGNIHSVRNAFDYLGYEAVITGEPEILRRADSLVLPGVGAFGQCMRNLRESGLDEVLTEAVLRQGKPFLGICLGMQVLADTGLEKGTYEGLGWIPGTVRSLAEISGPLKVPHVGWNEILIRDANPLFAGIRKDRSFYFVHSYYFDAVQSGHVAAVCGYGQEFPCALFKDNLFATQFHPEKSQKNGLMVLDNFAKWRP